MRSIALDVHQSFCEVAICEQGEVRSAGRIKTDRAELEQFAASLGPSDQVVMEATGPAMEIARIIAPHVARVVVANASEVRAISHARVKSDRFDARTLARLLHADMLESVWVPDAEISALRRRVARRAALVRQRTRAKNEVHAALVRCLLGRSPATDLFGVAGRAWLAEQELPAEEAETVAGAVRQIDFLDIEIEAIDRRLAEWALGSADARRLITIPGIGVATAVTLMATIGEISRFDSPRKLVAYLGLDPKVRQSGEDAARHGPISKRGNAHARSVLVEAAWTAVRSPGPLRAFGERIRAHKGSQVAAVAVARKIACLSWQLLATNEDYAYGRPSLVRQKLRQAERATGAKRLPTRHDKTRIRATAADRDAERQIQQQAEATYRRLVADWRATATTDAGATTGRASSRPSKRHAARQAQAPEPTL
jgi:transposase